MRYREFTVNTSEKFLLLDVFLRFAIQAAPFNDPKDKRVHVIWNDFKIIFDPEAPDPK